MFRVLRRVDQVTVDPTIRCVDCIRGATLARMAVRMVEEVEDAMKGLYVIAEAATRLLACRVVELTLSWRDRRALDQKRDLDFLGYLERMNSAR